MLQQNIQLYLNCPIDTIQLKLNVSNSACLKSNDAVKNLNETYVKISGLLGNVYVCVRDSIELNLENTLNIEQRLCIKAANNLVLTNPLIINNLHKELRNKIVGITKGMYCYMQLKGLGFRSQVKNGNLILRAGLSCLSYFELDSTIRIKRIKKHTLKIFGVDIQTYQDTRLSIQKIRKPSAYNERGLIFKGEVRKLKQGKRSKY